MSRLRVLLPALTLTACATAGGNAKQLDQLQARVAKLEATNKQYADSLAFLQKVYDQQKQQAKEQAENEPAPDAVFAVDVGDDVAAGQVDGPATAPVTIVEAWDFACPYCAKVSPTLDELVADYKGQVRVVYKNMIVHPQVATIAHHAGCAAAKQHKFVAFKRAWWAQGFQPYADSQGANKDSLSRDSINRIAHDVGLDPAKFASDMDSEGCEARITADRTELDRWHVNATPSFFINGQPFTGALDKDAFHAVIDAKLALAKASGVAPADYYQREIIGKGEKVFRSAAGR